MDFIERIGIGLAPMAILPEFQKQGIDELTLTKGKVDIDEKSKRKRFKNKETVSG